jgi:hypothetical protein
MVRALPPGIALGSRAQPGAEQVRCAARHRRFRRCPLNPSPGISIIHDTTLAAAARPGSGGLPGVWSACRSAAGCACAGAAADGHLPARTERGGGTAPGWHRGQPHRPRGLRQPARLHAGRAQPALHLDPRGRAGGRLPLRSRAAQRPAADAHPRERILADAHAGRPRHLGGAGRAGLDAAPVALRPQRAQPAPRAARRGARRLPRLGRCADARALRARLAAHAAARRHPHRAGGGGGAGHRPLAAPDPGTAGDQLRAQGGGRRVVDPLAGPGHPRERADRAHHPRPRRLRLDARRHAADGLGIRALPVPSRHRGVVGGGRPRGGRRPRDHPHRGEPARRPGRGRGPGRGPYR